QNLRGGSRLPAEFVPPRRHIHVKVRKAIEHLGESSQIIALIAEMACDERSHRLAIEEAVTNRKYLGIGRNVVAVLVIALIAGRPLLVIVGRLPGGRMVGHVDVDRQLQFGALSPKRAQARIVGMKALVARKLGTTRVSGSLFGHLTDSARALAIAALQFSDGALRIIGSCDVGGIDAAVKLETSGIRL